MLLPCNGCLEASKRVVIAGQGRYSRELHALILELLMHPPTIFSLCDMLSGRAFDELDTTYRILDACQLFVLAEIGAGRVLRVLLQLSSAISGDPYKAS